MIVKIALFTSYGGGSCPKELENMVKSSGKHWRIALAECIENLECNYDYLNQEIYDNFERGNTDNWYLKSNDSFFYKDEDNTVRKIELKVVDTDKKWKVKEYDGAESICYFKEPILVDKELNLYNW